MLLALLIYAYAVGQRSSRRIEDLCVTDVAFRVICAEDVPDHSTIARFRKENREAVAGLFVQVLELAGAAGLGRVGWSRSTAPGSRRTHPMGRIGAGHGCGSRWMR